MMLLKKAHEKDTEAADRICRDCPMLDVGEVGAWSVNAGRCESLMDESLA